MSVDINDSPLAFARVLADSTRQQIMAACCCGWLSVGEIVEVVEVGQPTVSHHLSVLREAGLVHVQQIGRNTFYTLNQERVVLCCGKIMQAFAPEAAGKPPAEEGAA